MLFALGLRLRGIDFLLPHEPVNDEYVFLSQVELMKRGDPGAKLEEGYGFYPHLVARLALPFFPRTPHEAPVTLAEHWQRASAGVLYLRHVVVVLSLLVVPATYFLARLYLSRSTSLLAAAIVSASLLHLRYSAQARPHGVTAGFFLLGVLAAVWVRRRGHRFSYICAGIAAALAATCHQSGFLVLASFVVAHLLSRKTDSPRADLRLLAPLAIIAIAIFVLYPFAFTGSRVLAEGRAVDGSSGVPASHHFFGAAKLRSELFDGSGFAFLFQGFWDHDPWILVLAAAGLCGLAFRRRLDVRRIAAGSQGRLPLRRWLAGREDLAVVLVFLVPYITLFGMCAATAPRHALPLVPFAACLAASGTTLACEALTTRIGLLRWQRALFSGVALLVLAIQATPALRLAAIRAAPDTAKQAVDWIMTNLDPGVDRIAILPTIDLPILRDEASLRMTCREPIHPNDAWMRHQCSLAEVPSSLPSYFVFKIPAGKLGVTQFVERGMHRCLSERNIDYLVVQRYVHQGFQSLPRLWEDLRSNADLMARFSSLAVDEGEDTFFSANDEPRTPSMVPDWVWYMVHARSFGPVIEVYRMR